VDVIDDDDVELLCPRCGDTAAVVIGGELLEGTDLECGCEGWLYVGFDGEPRISLGAAAAAMARNTMRGMK